METTLPRVGPLSTISRVKGITSGDWVVSGCGQFLKGSTFSRRDRSNADHPSGLYELSQKGGVPTRPDYCGSKWENISHWRMG